MKVLINQFLKDSIKWWIDPLVFERNNYYIFNLYIKSKLTFDPSSFLTAVAATYAKYWMTFLVFSVLPAPDSPLNI